MKRLNINSYKLQINIRKHYYDVYISNIKDIDLFINISGGVVITSKDHRFITSTYFHFSFLSEFKIFNIPQQKHFIKKENELIIKLLYQRLYGL